MRGSPGAKINNQVTVKAQAPTKAYVSDGYLAYPINHIYKGQYIPKDQCVVDLKELEYSEFSLTRNTGFTLAPYNISDGARYRLIIHKTTKDPIRVRFDGCFYSYMIREVYDSVVVLIVEVISNGIDLLQRVILCSADSNAFYLTEDVVCVNAEDMGREDGYTFPLGMSFTEYVKLQHRRSNVVYYYIPTFSFAANISKVEVGTTIKPVLTVSNLYLKDSAGISSMRYYRASTKIYEGGENLSYTDSVGVTIGKESIAYKVEADYMAPATDKTNDLGEVDTTNKYVAGTESKTVSVVGDYKHIAVTLGYDPGTQNGAYFKSNNVLTDVWSDEDYILPLDGVKFIAILVPPGKTLNLDKTVNPAGLNDKIMANEIVTTSNVEVPIGSGSETATYKMYRYLAAVAYDGDENELQVTF